MGPQEVYLAEGADRAGSGAEDGVVKLRPLAPLPAAADPNSIKLSYAQVDDDDD